MLKLKSSRWRRREGARVAGVRAACHAQSAAGKRVEPRRADPEVHRYMYVTYNTHLSFINYKNIVIGQI